MDSNPLAIVTGASSGIGLELAKLCAKNGYDLLIAADEASVKDAAEELADLGAQADWVQTDLATSEGVQKLTAGVQGRRVAILIANAGHGLGGAFLEQDFEKARHVINTNVTGTLELIQSIARTMKKNGEGKILMTGSIAGFTPGTFQAVYNATKAFIDSFSFALRAELKGSGVTVTCLMPGATDTNFFARAGMLNTKVSQGEKDDPADVAASGFAAMMKGKGDVVTGWKNKIQTAIANVTPAGMLAEQHRKMAQPLPRRRAAS